MKKLWVLYYESGQYEGGVVGVYDTQEKALEEVYPGLCIDIVTLNAPAGSEKHELGNF